MILLFEATGDGEGSCLQKLRCVCVRALRMGNLGGGKTKLGGRVIRARCLLFWVGGVSSGGLLEEGKLISVKMFEVILTFPCLCDGAGL